MEFHYNVVLAPILSFGAISMVSFVLHLVKKKTKSVFTLLLVSTFITGIMVWGILESSWNDPDLPLHKLNRAEFYDREFIPRRSTPTLRLIEEIIPPEKSISAASGLVPSLSGRDHIYNFPAPFPKQTQWVVLSPEFNTWPLHRGEMESFINDFMNNKDYELIWQDYGIWAFKKIPRSK
jgi:uncharacterized membrane protein